MSDYQCSSDPNTQEEQEDGYEDSIDGMLSENLPGDEDEE